MESPIQSLVTRKRRRQIDPKQPSKRPKPVNLEVVASQPSFAFLPDNVALRIMALLDIPSLLSLSQVNRRFYLLHSDEYIWSDVYLSTSPRLDVQTLKRLVRDKFHPGLWRLTIHSNAVECQRKHKLRPVITSSALDDIFEKCPKVRQLTLYNCDILQLSGECLLWSSVYLENMTFFNCIAPFRWLEQRKPCWPRLRHLYLHHTNKTSDHDLTYLATQKETAGKFYDLRHLSVRKCCRVGKAGIKSLVDSFANLHMLDISECNGVPSACLHLIAEHMTELQHLNISNCVHMPSVDDADELLSKLQANCINLKVLTVCAAQLHLDEDPCSKSNVTRLNHLTFKLAYEHDSHQTSGYIAEN